MIKKKVPETCSDEGAVEELNTSEVNKFMEERNDASTVDKLEIYRENTEINQKVKSRDACLSKFWELWHLEKNATMVDSEKLTEVR